MALLGWKGLTGQKHVQLHETLRTFEYDEFVTFLGFN
jgi:hypothetical protein